MTVCIVIGCAIVAVVLVAMSPWTGKMIDKDFG